MSAREELQLPLTGRQQLSRLASAVQVLPVAGLRALMADGVTGRLSPGRGFMLISFAKVRVVEHRTRIGREGVPDGEGKVWPRLGAGRASVP